MKFKGFSTAAAAGALILSLTACSGDRMPNSYINDIENSVSESKNPAYGSMGMAEIRGKKYDIATTTELNLSYLDLTNEDLIQVGKLVNLTCLGLGGNQISDITPLADLRKLRSLGLYKNQISDITPLADLTELTSLGLYGNQISDISSLANLVNLKELSLQDNQISDISALADLRDLTDLYLMRNEIKETDLNWLISQLPDCFIRE